MAKTVFSSHSAIYDDRDDFWAVTAEEYYGAADTDYVYRKSGHSADEQAILFDDYDEARDPFWCGR